MGESGLPADHRLTGGQSAQINGRPGRPIPLPHGKRSAAGRAHGHNWRAAGGRVEAPSMAHDAGRGIRRRARAEGSWPGPREKRPTEAKHARRGGPTTRPFCKSILLERILLQMGLARRRLAADCFWPSRPTFPPPFPQTCGGRNGLISRVSALGAFPANVWRQRSETFIGHRASGGQRLLTPVALWLSKQVQNRLPHMCSSHTYVLICMYETFC